MDVILLFTRALPNEEPLPCFYVPAPGPARTRVGDAKLATISS